MKTKVSPEVVVQAKKIAKGTQKAGQTKEQTKLIAQGIEKGIAEYKKQQNKKLREIDKQRKQKIKQQEKQNIRTDQVVINDNPRNILPWALLLVSWLCFTVYTFL